MFGVCELIELEHGQLILSYYSTIDATALRAVCRRFCGAVAAYPWDDRDACVFDLRSWARAFARRPTGHALASLRAPRLRLLAGAPEAHRAAVGAAIIDAALAVRHVGGGSPDAGNSEAGSAPGPGRAAAMVPCPHRAQGILKQRCMLHAACCMVP